MSTNIISQLTKSFKDELFNAITEMDIMDLVNNLGVFQTKMNRSILKLVSGVLSVLDNRITESPERRRNGFLVQKRDVERTLVTPLGELTYKRAYFTDKESGERFYLLDGLIGVERYERITKETIAKILNNACETSYEKAAGISGTDITRQTVSNRLHALGEIVPEFNEEKIACSRFEVFVDEDHVSVRDENGKKRSCQVPVAVVATGVDDSNPKRHNLENTLHLAEFGTNPSAFFNDLYAMMSERYSYRADTPFVVHADGGNWIKHAEEVFPNVSFAMDGFHLNKYKKSIKKYCDAQTKKELDAAIGKEKQEEFEELTARVKETLIDTKDAKEFGELATYFTNNWESIQKRLSGAVVGSCTEAMVSHLTAERISRTPCVWSEEGLAQMAMMRTLRANGGHVKPSDIRVHRDKDEERKMMRERAKKGFEAYNKIIEEERTEIIKAIKERFREDRGTFYIDVASGTQMYLKKLSRVPTNT